MEPTFGLSGNWREFEKAFAAIGSIEFPRAVAYALDETAKSAAVEMKARMPTSLGRKIPGGWQPSSFILDGIGYRRSGRYDAVAGVDQIRSRVEVKPKQSVVLKYLFGQGMQERLPGDAGLADGVILIPNRQNLFYTTRISGMTPFEGGRLPRTAMAQIERRVQATRKGGDAFAAAMRTMGGSALALGAAFAPMPGGYAKIPRRLQAGAPRDAKALGHYLTSQRKATGLDVRDDWGLYRGKDRTGRETVFARPQRLRDPAGGWHEVTRADGTRARFPNMVGISRFDGHSGPRLGPRRLFTPVDRASYAPILQAPWDNAAAMAHEAFPALMRAELDRRLARRAEGRRY